MEAHINTKLQGIFAPIPTPFDQHETLDLDAMTHNLALYDQSGIRGCLILGSNGENKSLDNTETTIVLKTVFDNMGTRLTRMVGVMLESNVTANRFIRQSADLGADCVLVQSPSYFRKLMTEDTLLRFFSDIADTSPIPILVYNSPGFNGITLSTELLERLSEHPNIVGMKDSTPGCDTEVMRLNRSDFQVMAGSASKLKAFMELGSIGGTVSLANYAPDLAMALYHDLLHKGSESCTDLNDKVLQLNKRIAGNFGVPGVKAAMQLTGFQGGLPRRPLQPLQADQIETIRSALIEAGVLQP